LTKLENIRTTKERKIVKDANEILIGDMLFLKPLTVPESPEHEMPEGQWIILSVTEESLYGYLLYQSSTEKSLCRYRFIWKSKSRIPRVFARPKSLRPKNGLPIWQIRKSSFDLFKGAVFFERVHTAGKGISECHKKK
jgi:hypothetical protein